MSKPLLGLALGGVLGIFDGLTALFEPDVSSMVASIVMWSTIKGLITGVATGLIARKLNSLPVGIITGLLIGAALSFTVAAIPNETGNHYYLQIMLPGSVLGAIVGFATTRYGRPAAKAA